MVAELEKVSSFYADKAGQLEVSYRVLAAPPELQTGPCQWVGLQQDPWSCAQGLRGVGSEHESCLPPPPRR